MAKQSNVLAVSGVPPDLKRRFEELAKENASSVSAEVRKAMLAAAREREGKAS
jgi:phage terminase Nu1 subunit (DNA packaging protein)